MRVEKLTTVAQLQGLESEWRAMEPDMASLPFVSFDWVAAWWECMRSDRLTVRDSLCFLTFRDTLGKLCGVAPLMLTARPGRGPLRLKVLQFIGADTNVTELRGISAPEALAEPVYAAMVDYLRDHDMSCDWIKFSGVRSQEHMSRIESRFGALRWSREIPDFVLQLQPTWDEFKTELPRNIKESLRKCYNAPKRDGVEFDLVRVSQGPELEAAVSEFLRLHTARSSLTDTVAHANAFRWPESQRFLYEVCRRFSRSGRVRIYQLQHKGAVVATRIGFVCNDSLYLYYSGYDPAYAQYSVMTRVVVEAIQDAIASGLKEVNMSVGRDVSKERWRPDEIPYHEAEVVWPSGWRASKYGLFKAVTGARFKQSWLGRLMARGA